ncbi:MAG: putative DNA binding domain-containing protein [Bacteroidales bacterium]|nr:putative DNA binding domain-containing protein [Candidatus Liminaster caballi]
MALPISIKQLLEGNIVEWERLDFKEGWNPEDVIHSMCAFANDIHNWGGGYIVVGVKEQDGVPVLPPVGVNLHVLDDIQKDLVKLTFKVEPYVTIVSEPVEYMGKMILVIYVPGGDTRPYKCPIHLGKSEEQRGKVYYVRQTSVTRQANEVEEQQLISLAAKVPFDDRICHQASITDMSKLLIGDYLNRVGSSITESDLERMSMEEICRSMHIASGSTEFFKPKNVGLLFFSRKAEEYIPYARIEIVHFHDEVGDHFDEKVLHGPIHLQYEEAMRYLNEMLVEKVMKVKGESEAVRVWNYPYQALEEVVANAIFHKSWDDRNPIEIRINKDSIEVYNLAGPTPPITNADLQKEKVINRSYRNRRIGDFLKELHITEGRSTGFPKIYRALKNNDSPLPEFDTDEHNQYFLATIKIHEAFINEDAYLKKIGKERDVEAENVLENVPNNVLDKLTERQRVIYGIIKLNVPNNVPNNVPDDGSDFAVETVESLASKLSVSTKSIKRDLKRMKELGVIKREGGNFGGHWEIIK